MTPFHALPVANVKQTGVITWSTGWFGGGGGPEKPGQAHACLSQSSQCYPHPKALCAPLRTGVPTVFQFPFPPSKQREIRANRVWKLWQGRGKQSTQSLQTLARKRTSHPRTCRTQACLGHSSTQLTFLFFQLLREATRPRKDQFLTQSASWQAPPILQQVQFWWYWRVFFKDLLFFKETP